MSIPLLKARKGWGGTDVHINKGVTVRFGFDAVRISQIQTVCQEQSNGNALWDVSYIQPFLALDRHYPLTRRRIISIHHRGAFSVARFDILGNARAFTAWNEDRTGSTFFFYMHPNLILTANQGVVGLLETYQLYQKLCIRDLSLF